jgi:hypothetical protein
MAFVMRIFNAEIEVLKQPIVRTGRHNGKGDTEARNPTILRIQDPGRGTKSPIASFFIIKVDCLVVSTKLVV